MRTLVATPHDDSLSNELAQPADEVRLPCSLRVTARARKLVRADTGVPMDALRIELSYRPRRRISLATNGNRYSTMCSLPCSR